jgi:DNA gyrase subunit B
LIENGVEQLAIQGLGDRDIRELLKIVARYRETLENLKIRYPMIDVIRFMVEEEIITTDYNVIFENINNFLVKKGFNILTKELNDNFLNIFVQTDRGIEEIMIDESLFSNPQYKEAIYLFNIIKTREITDSRDVFVLLEDVESRAKKGAYIQRYKGLGEMNPDQLWETTMNMENRTLLKVTAKDAQKADDMFKVLMGDDVEARRNLIELYAKDVKNLDI